MNLDMMREISFHKHCIEFVMQHLDAPPPLSDQTVINGLYGDRLGCISEEWNCFSNMIFGDGSVLPRIIHFAGEAPWRKLKCKRDLIPSVMMLWHSFHASIYQITIWQSLRRFYSVRDIIVRRCLSLLFSNKCFGPALCRFIFRKTPYVRDVVLLSNKPFNWKRGSKLFSNSLVKS